MNRKDSAILPSIQRELGQLPPRRTDALLDVLRKHIRTGELAPGQRLNLDEIAQQSGVSRGPVRDALKQLETEGLVAIYPQRGIEVTALNAEDIGELFGIRIVLEQKAVELAVLRLTSEDHEQMHDLLMKMDKLTGRSVESSNGTSARTSRCWAQTSRNASIGISIAHAWTAMSSGRDR